MSFAFEVLSAEFGESAIEIVLGCRRGVKRFSSEHNTVTIAVIEDANEALQPVDSASKGWATFTELYNAC